MSGKVNLQPGFHLSDWINLTRAASDLSGRRGRPLLAVTRDELARHTSEHDAWAEFHGKVRGIKGMMRGPPNGSAKCEEMGRMMFALVAEKVYNISPYLRYHPGGADMLLKVAGKNGEAMFNKYHAWVNLDAMMGKCLVGRLVESKEEGDEAEKMEEGGEKKETRRDPTGVKHSEEAKASLEQVDDDDGSL